eukprot:306662-Chlamydomonas_euryale.AAC.5
MLGSAARWSGPGGTRIITPRVARCRVARHVEAPVPRLFARASIVARTNCPHSCELSQPNSCIDTELPTVEWAFLMP